MFSLLLSASLLFSQYIQDHNIHGMSVGIKGKKESIDSFGKLDYFSPVQVTPHTVFLTGPLREAAVMVLLAQMVYDRRVSLHDPISKYLPKSEKVPSYRGKQITLLDLATHTSGLPNGKVEGVGNLFRFLGNYQLTQEPGSNYEYSRIGYALLIYLLEHIGQNTLSKLMESVLFKPLDMEDTGWRLTKKMNERFAKSKLTDRMLFTTPSDWMDLLSFYLGESPLIPILLKAYREFPDFGVALGWKIQNGQTYYMGNKRVYMTFDRRLKRGGFIFATNPDISPLEGQLLMSDEEL